jgi:hypothetical protein
VGTASTTLRFDFASGALAKVFVEKVSHQFGCATMRDEGSVFVIGASTEIEAITMIANRLGGMLAG